MMIVPPKELVLMQGIPGSGKSTVARNLRDAWKNSPLNADYSTEIFSTDEYWFEKGVYRFDPAKSGQAHQWNQLRTLDAMQYCVNWICIENTNIQKWQAQPYLVLAKLFNYKVQVVTVSCGLDEALSRNAQRDFDRQVPEATVRQMYADLEPLL